MNQTALVCSMVLFASLTAYAGDTEECTATKTILARLEKDGAALHTSQANDFSSSTTYPGTVKLPGADACEYIVKKDGSPPYYRCALLSKPCDTIEKRYEALADKLTTCLAPTERQVKAGEDSKQSKWVVKSPLRVRLVLKLGASCGLSYWVENL